VPASVELNVYPGVFSGDDDGTAVTCAITGATVSTLKVGTLIATDVDVPATTITQLLYVPSDNVVYVTVLLVLALMAVVVDAVAQAPL
jgi:hypothetical protein